MLPDEQASDIRYDLTTQRVALAFSKEFQSGQEAVLHIEYTGTINNLMCGFYRSRYRPTVSTVAPTSDTESGKEAYMLSTQFESSDARRAFPCFDEPNLKATFDFRIEVPDDLVAVSNMPEMEVAKGANGRKLVSFEKTPIMSTYVGICMHCVIHSYRLMGPSSFSHGLLATLSMSRSLHAASMMESSSQYASTPLEGSKSRAVLLLE